jgi:ribosomal protein S18 acetylase RimI-like enzyme
MVLSPTVTGGSSVAIRKLSPEDVEATACLLARAFADNACYAFMHPRAATRVADLTAFFRRNLTWHAPLGLTWVAAGASGDVIATATLEPPGGVPSSIGRLVRHWVVPTLRERGLGAVARIVWTDAEFGRHYRRLAGQETYWHVHAVAVDPAAQGRGAGTAIMRHALEALDALRVLQPAPVVLSTQRERNVGFYERFGFELARRARMGAVAPGEAFTSWFMRRRCEGR